MKQYIFLRKLMVISLLPLISGALSATNASIVGNTIFEKNNNSNSVSIEVIATKEVSIEVLSEVQTFQLGKQIFGGVEGLTSLGSGFVQTAPGATEDLNPKLNTKKPPTTGDCLSLDVDNEVRNQLIKLIDKPNLSSLGLENLEARLHVMINQRKEIVVLLVETDSDFVDQYLKSKLNYKKLSPGTIGGRYTMKVTLKNS
jgi:hypothetical protein